MAEHNQIPSDEKIQKVIEGMNSRNFNAEVVNTKQEALEKVKSMLPAGAEVAAGSSTTLNEVGFSDFLQSADSNIVNLNGLAWAEQDEAKRNDLRRKSVTAEYFLSSVNAITEDGMLVAVDATGSRVTALPFAAKNVILVVGVNKISGNLDEAFKRIKEHVFPLENERATKAYGAGSTFGKWVILEKEVNPSRIHVILVKEKLGF